MRRRRGVAAIEFALIFPVLIVALVGIMELSWYFSRYLAVTEALSQGARRGALVLEGDDVDAVVSAQVAKTLAAVGVETADAALTVTQGADDAGVDGLTITLSVPYRPLLNMTPAPAALQATTRVRLEDQD